MSRKITVCELWREAGYCAASGSTWDDVLSLERGANGHFILSFSRNPNGSDASDDRTEEPVLLYCSPEFRRPERLLELLLGQPTEAMERYETWPDLSVSDVIRMLSEVMQIDAGFAREALCRLAQRLQGAEATIRKGPARMTWTSGSDLAFRSIRRLS